MDDYTKYQKVIGLDKSVNYTSGADVFLSFRMNFYPSISVAKFCFFPKNSYNLSNNYLDYNHSTCCVCKTTDCNGCNKTNLTVISTKIPNIQTYNFTIFLKDISSIDYGLYVMTACVFQVDTHDCGKPAWTELKVYPQSNASLTKRNWITRTVWICVISISLFVIFITLISVCYCCYRWKRAHTKNENSTATRDNATVGLVSDGLTMNDNPVASGCGSPHSDSRGTMFLIYCEEDNLPVLELSNFLCFNGVNSEVDMYHSIDDITDWNQWTTQQAKEACDSGGYILLLCGMKLYQHLQEVKNWRINMSNSHIGILSLRELLHNHETNARVVPIFINKITKELIPSGLTERTNYVVLSDTIKAGCKDPDTIEELLKQEGNESLQSLIDRLKCRHSAAGTTETAASYRHI